MTSLDVHSNTQRIVVKSSQRIVVEDKIARVINSNKSVQVILAGPPGPPGHAPPSFAEGVQPFPSQTWIMNYNLGGKPAAFRFFDETEQEWEPQEITYINPTRSVAQWPEPMMGSWIAS